MKWKIKIRIYDEAQNNENFQELLQRAKEDAEGTSDELVNLADNPHALVDDYVENLDDSVQMSDFDTSNTSSYEDEDIKYLKVLKQFAKDRVCTLAIQLAQDYITLSMRS